MGCDGSSRSRVSRLPALIEPRTGSCSSVIFAYATPPQLRRRLGGTCEHLPSTLTPQSRPVHPIQRPSPHSLQDRRPPPTLPQPKQPHSPTPFPTPHRPFTTTASRVPPPMACGVRSAGSAAYTANFRQHPPTPLSTHSSQSPPTAPGARSPTLHAAYPGLHQPPEI